MSVTPFVPNVVRFFKVGERAFYGAFGHFQVTRNRGNRGETLPVFIGTVAQIHVHRNRAVREICRENFAVVKQKITP